MVFFIPSSPERPAGASPPSLASSPVLPTSPHCLQMNSLPKGGPLNLCPSFSQLTYWVPFVASQSQPSTFPCPRRPCCLTTFFPPSLLPFLSLSFPVLPCDAEPGHSSPHNLPHSLPGLPPSPMFSFLLVTAGPLSGVVLSPNVFLNSVPLPL